jgi:nicotinamide riboside kinase
MYIINLFGGPSSGKSTLGALLFSILKSKYDLNCEYVTEYAKDLVYENRKLILQHDQLYIFAKQNHKLLMIQKSNDVDFIINDSPLILSNIFASKYSCNQSKCFKKLVRDVFNSYQNLNFYIKRNDNFFRKSGRIEKNVNDAKLIDIEIKNELDKYFEYIEIENDVNEILNSNIFLNALEKVKNGRI